MSILCTTYPCPNRIRERLREIPQVGMHKTTDIANGGDQFRSIDWCSQPKHGSLLDSICKRRESNVLTWVCVPFCQIVPTEDGETSAVEPVVRVEGVDSETLDHPADFLGVTGLECSDPGRTGQVVVIVGINGELPVRRRVSEREYRTPTRAAVY